MSNPTQAPRRLGRYELGAMLGSGGMGEVYRATDGQLGREVAVKILPRALASDADLIRRFEQEARAVGQLDHPNILTVHDVGTENGSPYLVTELLHGESLRERLSGGPLAPEHAIEYAVQIAEGLAAAHASGVVHRDLKPENLFVTNDGRVKILDFGLAKLTIREGGVPSSGVLNAETEPGSVIGTTDYMSPEHVRGSRVDVRSDLFALGAVLYEMLTGSQPFHRESPAETMVAIVREDPDMSKLPPSCSGAVRRLLRRCLEKSPEARFQSSRDLAFALAGSYEGETVRTDGRLPRSTTRLVWLKAFGVVAFALGLGLLARSGILAPKSSPPAPRIQSLAILPLRNLSADPAQEFFADGMTEALITTLGRIRQLRVISRTSVMRFKQSRQPLSAIARELGADAVVEGTIQRSGERVRITARLIDASEDRPLWAESYDREVREVLALQSEIAGRIANEIGVQITRPERSRLDRIRPMKPAIYDEYLQGLYHWNRRTPDRFAKAIAHLDRAIAGDPGFAPAHAALADCYNLLGSVETGALPPRVAMPRARQSALRALALDGDLAQAHASLGHYKLFFDWDWAGAESSFLRAIDLDPSYATAHQWYGIYLMLRGRMDEAIREGNQARLLDPLSLVLQVSLGNRYFYARRYEDAVRLNLQALDLDASFAPAHFHLARAYVAMGRMAEALDHYREALRLSGGSPAIQGFLGHALAKAGQPEEARRILRNLEVAARTRYVPAQAFTAIYVGLGQRERAVAWLHRAYEERSGMMVYLAVDPVADGYRSDPRVAELLRKVQ